MERQIRQTIYSPTPRVADFRMLLRTIMTDLMSCRFLAWRLFVRNLSAQHRQTVMGYLWLLLPPIVTTALWVFLNSQNILKAPSVDIPYPAFVLTGTILWQGFVDALNSPLQMVLESKSMLSKVNFPHEALILAGLGGVFFNLCIRLSLLFFIFFWFDVSVSTSLLLVPLGIFALLGFGLMLGLILLPLGLLYGDVQRILTVITGLWFFVTPIIYPAPSGWPAVLVSSLNPVSPLLITTRQWVFGTSVTQIGSFLFVACISMFLLIVGWVVYRLAMPHLIERIGS